MGKGLRLWQTGVLVGIATMSMGSLAPSLAQTPGNALSGISGNNSREPIDIESDRLEVDDKSQIAVFTGNVSATQGDHNLRSERLEVVYERANQAGSQTAGGTTPPKPAVAKAAPAGDTSGQQIKTITAIGNVVVTSTTDAQTGTGDKGFFDVKAQRVTLWVEKPHYPNHCVLLSQKGGNVVKGAKLIMNLETGITDIEPCSSRVSTILIPGSQSGGGGNAQGSAKKKTETKTVTPATSSSPWQTQNR